jgi:hypothetical protein
MIQNSMDLEKLKAHLITPRDQINNDPAKVGQAVFDILSKPQPTTTVEEVLDEYQHSYVKELGETIESNQKRFKAPFHVVVLHKKEPWAENVLRNWFIARQTRPKADFLRFEFPNHSNTVYRVNQDIGKIEVLWSLPTWQDSLTIMRNPHLYDPQLVQWIRDYSWGKLDEAS